MLNQAVAPPEIMESIYSAEPAGRAAGLPGIVSLNVKDLFPDIPQEVYSLDSDLSVVRKATENALSNVKMEMIKILDSVNILCSEQGFDILEGKPYAEMIKTIKDVIEKKVGCKNVRLRIGISGGGREAEGITKHFKFDSYFNGKVARVGPRDKGVPIETEIGTVWGVARAYDADWIIHAHYDFPREVYLHRLIDRTIKAFAMSYARMETRAMVHLNFGNRSANFVSRAIVNSPFVQQRFAYTCFMMTSPSGVIGIDADNDLKEFNKRLTINTLRSFGKLQHLLAEIDECIVIIDGGRIMHYISTGGLSAVNMFHAHLDFFDLRLGSSTKKIGSPLNPAVRALVLNSAWPGFLLDLPLRALTVLAGKELEERFRFTSSARALDHTVTAENLESAVSYAKRITNTDNILIFDGSYGSINLSPSLGELMIKKAPEVSQMVEEQLLPMWLKQRGIDPETV